MKRNLQEGNMAQPTWLAKLDLSLAQLSPSLLIFKLRMVTFRWCNHVSNNTADYSEYCCDLKITSVVPYCDQSAE